MLHGRVVRPRGQGAYGDGTSPKILSVDESSIKHIPGVQVVRFGNFLGVVAPTEYAAIQAAAQLKVKWADPPVLPGVGNLWKGMRDHDTAGKAPARIALNIGNFDTAFKSAAFQVNQTYKFHYTGHLPIGPSCCVADVTPNGARIFTNTQDAYGTRQNIKDVLDVVMGSKAPALNRIRLTYVEGSSVYGSAPYSDANQAAAIMSAIIGKPVRLQFMRWDEHGWDNYGPAQMTDIRAGADANGNITAFEFTHFGIPYCSTQPAQQQVIAGRRQFPTLATQYAAQGRAEGTISGAQYAIPNWRVDREEPAAAEQLLQRVVPAGAGQPAVGVRGRAGRRRAGLHGEDGSGRVPAPERRHDDEPAGRRAAVEERAHRRRRRTRTGSRRWRPRTSRAPTSSRAAASRSASTRTR